jgi:hypothetical protein
MTMTLAMRALSLTSALVHVVLVGAASFLMWFYASFPFENQSPEDAASDDWLVGVAPLLAVLALLTGGAAVGRKANLLAIGLTAEAAVGALILTYALGESSHSDGRLMLATLAIMLSGTVAASATRRVRD